MVMYKGSIGKLKKYLQGQRETKPQSQSNVMATHYEGLGV